VLLLLQYDKGKGNTLAAVFQLFWQPNYKNTADSIWYIILH